jgi:hypothetical protein
MTFIRLCEKYRIMQPEPSSQIGGVLCVPKDWDFEEWNEMFLKYGPPPWSGSRDGLCK